MISWVMTSEYARGKAGMLLRSATFLLDTGEPARSGVLGCCACRGNLADNTSFTGKAKEFVASLFEGHR